MQDDFWIALGVFAFFLFFVLIVIPDIVNHTDDWKLFK